jgi:hypothetical protein
VFPGEALAHKTAYLAPEGLLLFSGILDLDEEALVGVGGSLILLDCGEGTQVAMQGELLGLRWEDIDLEHETLQVRRNLVGSKNGDPIFGNPKTAKGKHNVTLTEKAVEALERPREVQLEERRRFAGL